MSHRIISISRIAPLLVSIIFSQVLFSAEPDSQTDSLKSLIKQTEGKEKENVLNELSIKYLDINLDSSMHYANLLLETSIENNNFKGELQAYRRLGMNFERSGNIDTAIILYNKAIVIAEQIDDVQGVIAFNIDLGAVNIYLGKYDIALNNFLKSYELAKEIKDSGLIAKAVGNLGVINMKTFNHEKALNHFREASEIFRKMNDELSLAISLLNIGVVNKRLSDYETSNKYFNEAAEIFRRIGEKKNLWIANDNIAKIYKATHHYNKSLEIQRDNYQLARKINYKQGEAISLLAIGDDLASLKREDEALKSYFKSLAISDSIKFHPFTAWVQMSIGGLYVKTGEYKLAGNYLRPALNFANEVNNFDMLSTINAYYSEMFEAMGNYNKALKYYKLYQAYNDSVLSHEREQKIRELEIKYQTELKEKENALLQQELESEIFEKESEKEKTQSILIAWIGTVIILIGLAAIFILYRKSTVQKRNLRISEIKRLENEKTISELKIKTAAIEIEARQNLLVQINESLLMQSQLSNGLIDALKNQRKFASNEGKREISMVLSKVHEHLVEDSWRIFERNFLALYPDFFEKLFRDYDDLTRNEMRILAFMSKRMKAKDISLITFQSENSLNVAKGRIRAKLNFSANNEIEEYCAGLISGDQKVML